MHEDTFTVNIFGTYWFVLSTFIINFNVYKLAPKSKDMYLRRKTYPLLLVHKLISWL